MKSSHYFFASFWREKALDIGNKENQEAQQDCDFDNVIKKELYAST